MKTKFDAITSTSEFIRTVWHFRKLFRYEVIWIQYFHWPNTTTCAKYSCACVMPDRYFVFTCCNRCNKLRKGKDKRKHKKMEKFDPCACTYACVKAVFTC